MPPLELVGEMAGAKNSPHQVTLRFDEFVDLEDGIVGMVEGIGGERCRWLGGCELLKYIPDGRFQKIVLAIEVSVKTTHGHVGAFGDIRYGKGCHTFLGNNLAGGVNQALPAAETTSFTAVSGVHT